ncbi:MAG: endonuclease [Candidatus Delongbacteria bacterium]|nr:endonuclease [Candidatus Delongbacteria bacterium]
MKTKLIVSILSVLLFTYNAVADIPAGYYDTATGSGYTLKTQLHNIIDDHTVVSYDALWTHFQSTDVDHYYENDGSPLDMYSEDPDMSDPYNWSFVSDQCGSYTGEGSCYNREHSFPKSWFNDASPMYSDIFHLYLTDGYVNGRRSNYPFGEVGSASWTSQNGSKVGSSSYTGYTGTVFEPIDEFKGDFARSYFYMATRYEDVISGWPGSDMLDGSSDKVFTDWALNMLIDWHTNDPVSQKEIDRNNIIYDDVQHNRNPFIDNPNYVYQIWGGNPVPSLNFVTASQQIEENIGTLTVNLSISEAIPDAVTANLLITGSATDPDDYTISSTSVFFPASSTGNQSAVLTIEDDLIPEDFETITLTLDNLTTSNPDIIIGPSSQITITIYNSDGFDETPPTVLSHTIVDSTKLVLEFSEDLDPITSQLVSNYVVDNGLGNPVSATLGYLGDSTKVVLTFALIMEDVSYQLTINNVEDTASNSIATNTTVDFIISASGSEGWIEYFEDATFSSYYTGTGTYPTGDWDLLSVYLEPASEAYEGDHAVRMNDDTANSSITTPVINGVDSVIFYYRALNQEGSASTFWLQKSVDGGAFSNVTSQSYQNNTYAQFAYKVNDSSDNILLRVLNDDQAGHLIVDQFKVVTFSGPVGDTTPPTITGHEIANGSDIILDFDELLDPMTAQLATNYVLDNAVGNPDTAVLGYLGDFTKVVLSFSPFVEDVNYQLTINNVEDSAGNPIATDTTVDFIINSGGTGGGEGWIERFEDGTAFGSYYTGTVTYGTGDWDLVSIYLETTNPPAYEGTYALRLNDDTPNSSLTTPALNGVDSVIFQYRTLNSEGSPSTFWLQKSVDGEAFSNVTSQSYQVNSYNEFAYKVDDTSNNIKLRVLNDDQLGHLIIDYFRVVTFPVANDPDAPANVVTTISGSNLIIDWDVSAGATGYDVYSSDDPYGTFTLAASVGTNQYTVPADQAKLFYYIVAK